MKGGILKKGNSKTKKKRVRWTTAIEAAQTTLSKTGSLSKARKSLRQQALQNARRIFGSVGKYS